MSDPGASMNCERAIRRLLRRKHSKEYFTGHGWSWDAEHAKTFEDSLSAAQTCADWKLSEVEIVLRLRNGASDLFCVELC